MHCLCLQRKRYWKKSWVMKEMLMKQGVDWIYFDFRRTSWTGVMAFFLWLMRATPHYWVGLF